MSKKLVCVSEFIILMLKFVTLKFGINCNEKLNSLIYLIIILSKISSLWIIIFLTFDL